MLQTIEEAVRRVEAAVSPLSPATRSLEDAAFCVLAEPVCIDMDQPPFDRALMDGYAVRAEDVGAAPVALSVIEHIGAGHAPTRAVSRGQAAQINTGAPLPRGADAVVRVEDTEPLPDGRVRVLTSVAAGKFITRRAAYVRAGDEVLRAGMRLGPLELAAAATAGAARLRVYPPPKVGVITTGDELVQADKRLGAAAIRNSNIHLLPALVRACWAEPVLVTSVQDDPAEIGRRVDAALDVCDLLIMTGGVSMGEHDHVPSVLADHGCSPVFHKVAIKPGRPTLFATSRRGQPVFGLPGNPVSAFIGFKLFVQTALARLQGTHDSHRSFQARLDGRLPATGDRTSYTPARLSTCDDGTCVATPIPWGGSGDALGMAGAEAMIVRTPQQPPAGPADPVFVWLL